MLFKILRDFQYPQATSIQKSSSPLSLANKVYDVIYNCCDVFQPLILLIIYIKSYTYFKQKVREQQMESQNKNVLRKLLGRCSRPSDFYSKKFIEALKGTNSLQLAQIDSQLAHRLSLFMGSMVDQVDRWNLINSLSPIIEKNSSSKSLKRTGRRLFHISKQIDSMEILKASKAPLSQTCTTANGQISEIFAKPQLYKTSCLNCLDKVTQSEAIRHFIQTESLSCIQITKRELKNTHKVSAMICGLMNGGGGRILIGDSIGLGHFEDLHPCNQDKAEISKKLQSSLGVIYPIIDQSREISINYVKVGEKNGLEAEQNSNKTGMYWICLSIKPQNLQKIYFVKSKKHKISPFYAAYTFNKNTKISKITSPYNLILSQYARHTGKNKKIPPMHPQFLHDCPIKSLSTPYSLLPVLHESKISEKQRWKLVSKIREDFPNQSLLIISGKRSTSTIFQIISELHAEGINFSCTKIHQHNYLQYWLFGYDASAQNINLKIYSSTFEWKTIQKVTNYLQVRDHNYQTKNEKLKTKLKSFFECEIPLTEKLQTNSFRCGETKKKYSFIYFQDQVHALKYLCLAKQSQIYHARFVNKKYIVKVCSKSLGFFS